MYRAFSTGDPESPIVLIKGQLDFSYPCTEYIVLSVLVKLKFTTLFDLPDLPGSMKVRGSHHMLMLAISSATIETLGS